MKPAFSRVGQQQRHPALLAALFLLFGSIFALQTAWALLPAISTLFFIPKKQGALSVILFLLPLPFFYHFYYFPSSPIEIEGTFHIQKVRSVSGFSKGWFYRGNLLSQKGRTPCFIRSKQRYLVNSDYKIQGTLSKSSGLFFRLKTDQPWQPVERTWSIAEWRFQSKAAIEHYIHQKLSSQRSREFLTAMVTGEGENRMMRKEFNQLGLSHLIAISGFHFGLLTFIFHFLFRFFLPPKIEALCLIVLSTFYFILIGNTSAQRAWLVVMIVLVGQLIEKRSFSLNTIGVTLICALLIHPISSTTLSFQLSFLATGGIILLYRPIDHLLQLWIPKRSLQEVIAHSLIWKQGYILLSFFRSTLALTLAVHIALFPLFLLYFHSFSINSLVYNLFFPMLASISLILFLLSIPLGNWMHALNNGYTHWMLGITESPPAVFKTFYIETIPHGLVALYLTALFLLAMYYNREEQRSF